MICLCGAPLDLPERHTLLVCDVCKQHYVETDDLGWFNYTIEIYTPVEDKND